MGESEREKCKPYYSARQDQKLYFKRQKGLIFDDAEQNLYVGMKGMPGRKGIGIGHGDEIRYCPDTEIS